MSDDNVRSLFGQPIVRREVNPACVKILEQMVEAARSGEVVGVALVAVYSDEGTTTRRGGVLTIGALGQISRLHARVMRDLDDD